MLYQHSVRHLYENLIISEQFELKIPGEKASKKGPRKPALILTVPSCEIPLYDVKGRMHLFETFAHFMTNLCSNRVPSPAQLFGQIGTKFVYLFHHFLCYLFLSKSKISFKNIVKDLRAHLMIDYYLFNF